jgi:hypothetical protein
LFAVGTEDHLRQWANPCAATPMAVLRRRPRLPKLDRRLRHPDGAIGCLTCFPPRGLPSPQDGPVAIDTQP